VIRDPELLDFLAGRRAESISATVYRATRLGLEPTTPSRAGGRWMPRDSFSVLYTSFERDGALAEISFHLGMMFPVPRKPIAIHTLTARARKAIRITKEDFPALQVDPALYGNIDYKRTEVIGDAIGFLEFDAIIVPSARWHCENLVLIQDHQEIESFPDRVATEEVEWFEWAKAHGFVSE
jgi:RES domain-containing protein